MSQTTKPSVQEVVNTVRTRCGACLLDFQGVLAFEGPDAASFLHSQTTNDVMALGSGQGRLGALTDRKAHVQAVFSLHRLGDTYLMLLEKEMIAYVLERLEAFRFSENLTMTDWSQNYVFYTFQGPESSTMLDAIGLDQAMNIPSLGVTELYEVLGEPALLFRKSITGEDGYILCVSKAVSMDFSQKFHQVAAQYAVPELTIAAQRVLRIEAGLPKYGLDMDESNILPETGLEHSAVSYNKGCYIGQEVIARVKTYGTVQKALVGLVFEPDASLPSLNTPCILEDKTIGVIKSSVISPTLQAPIALAYLSKEYRIPNQTLQLSLGGKLYPVKVVMLPFYTPQASTEKAKTFYENGLAAFQNNQPDEAIRQLRIALALDPLLSDAYEALGVILSHQGEYDEAIALMHRLAELDPTSIMAHTNLSVFYMKQNRIEEAETEKAIATTMGFKQAMSEAKLKQTPDNTAQASVNQDKIAMFEEVLALDSEDSLANYSLGNIYLEAGTPEKAIPLLNKALETDSKYTVAYLSLGKALELNGQLEEAQTIYQKGIEIAAVRGDLMPLKEMQRRLEGLS